jgi:hypothetical protein
MPLERQPSFTPNRAKTVAAGNFAKKLPYK